MVVFHIPGPLREFANGAAKIRLDESPATVAEALEKLGDRYPGVRDRVLDDRGVVRPHVNVFIGSESIRDCGGLSAAVPPNGEISIIQAVSGG